MPVDGRGLRVASRLNWQCCNPCRLGWFAGNGRSISAPVDFLEYFIMPGSMGSHMKFIPAITIYHGRIAVVEGGTYEFLRTEDGRFRNPVNVVQELSGDEIFVLDIDGLERSSPNLGTIKRIGAYKDVWLDAGAQDVDDMMDLFVNDADYVVMGTKSIRNMNMLKQALEISDRIIFSVDWDGGIISPDDEIMRMDIRRLAETVSGFGEADSVIFMDLGSHRDRTPVDLGIIGMLKDYFDNVHVSAHVIPEDYGNLEDIGISGIIRDFRKMEGPVDYGPEERPAVEQEGETDE